MTTTKLLVTQEQVEEAIGPLRKFRHDCHSASLALVKSGLLGKSRVARGSCHGVIGQHSWAVVGNDCYDTEATIVDITLWSYDPTKPKVWIGTFHDGLHVPHGFGSCFQVPMPHQHGGEIITLAHEPQSDEAQEWLRLIGPLDAHGWMQVAHLPVFGWPAKEIIEAMIDTPAMPAFVAIDIEGMLTDRNPGELYF